MVTQTTPERLVRIATTVFGIVLDLLTATSVFVKNAAWGGLQSSYFHFYDIHQSQPIQCTSALKYTQLLMSELKLNYLCHMTIKRKTDFCKNVILLFVHKQNGGC